MTFKEKIIELLTNNGMFDDDAESVAALVMADKSNSAMSGRWNDRVDDYPPIMLQLLWLSVKRAAADYIAEHQPLAWYRPMFDEPSSEATAPAPSLTAE